MEEAVQASVQSSFCIYWRYNGNSWSQSMEYSSLNCKEYQLTMSIGQSRGSSAVQSCLNYPRSSEEYLESRKRFQIVDVELNRVGLAIDVECQYNMLLISLLPTLHCRLITNFLLSFLVANRNSSRLGQPNQ